MGCEGARVVPGRLSIQASGHEGQDAVVVGAHGPACTLFRRQGDHMGQVGGISGPGTEHLTAPEDRTPPHRLPRLTAPFCPTSPASRALLSAPLT